jgi:hypothetical protein
MNSTPLSQVRWTTADLAFFESDRNHRYEIDEAGQLMLNTNLM